MSLKHSQTSIIRKLRKLKLFKLKIIIKRMEVIGTVSISIYRLSMVTNAVITFWASPCTLNHFRQRFRNRDFHKSRQTLSTLRMWISFRKHAPSANKDCVIVIFAACSHAFIPFTTIVLMNGLAKEKVIVQFAWKNFRMKKTS